MKFMKSLIIIITLTLSLIFYTSVFATSLDEEICNSQAESCKIVCEARRKNTIEKIEVENGKMVAKNSAYLMSCLDTFNKK